MEETVAGERIYICFGVLGAIGVGKTHLVRDAANENLAKFEEYTNHTSLQAYINDQEKQATLFQMVMMQGAVVRTMAAYETLDAAHKSNRAPQGIAIERPMQENVIFALANHSAKKMSRTDLITYLRTVGQSAKDLEEFLKRRQKANLPSIRTIYVQPWAPEYMTMQRMIDRGRLAEDGYEDKYLSELADQYFMVYFEILILQDLIAAEGKSLQVLQALREHRLKAISWPTVHLPIVVDWTQYGTWKDLDRVLNNGSVSLLQWNQEQNHVLLSVHSASNEEEYYKMLPSCLSKRKSIAEHVYVADEEHPTDAMTVEVIHFDLDWYLVARSKKAVLKHLSGFRDMFFRARATRRDIHLHVTEQRFAELRDTHICAYSNIPDL
jgi:deoxyadenosine/deoxycytidine kinase